MAVSLRVEEEVAIVDLGADENRFTLSFFDELGEHLDQALAADVAALVTTASGKFYSNGLDVEWMIANPDRFGWYVDKMHRLFAQVLTFPVPTVAAISGHAFGAGAILALAHDQRVMRADRGYFCLPEVDLRMRFTPGMAAVVQAKLTPDAAITAMTTGRRLDGEAAASLGIVAATAPAEDLTAAALALLRPVGRKDRDTLGDIKTTLFIRALEALGKVSV